MLCSTNNLHSFSTMRPSHSIIAKTWLSTQKTPVLVSQAVATTFMNIVHDDDVSKHENFILPSNEARAMLRQNSWVEAGLVNGAIPITLSILKPDLESLGVNAMILVKFDYYSGTSLPNLKQGVVPIMASSKSGKLQIPLTLAWATTIHKITRVDT